MTRKLAEGKTETNYIYPVNPQEAQELGSARYSWKLGYEGDKIRKTG